MGTAHEFYLFLTPRDCAADLDTLIKIDPVSAQISRNGVAFLPDDHYLRWHIAGRYLSCSKRVLSHRGFELFDRLPLGLLPSSLGFSTPSLFDGQELSQDLSLSLDLKPGEVSYSTISIFADAWWRWRWPGVVVVTAVLGGLLALIQNLLLWLILRQPMAGLLGQLLVLSLVGTWINNTTLTMLWFLLWDLPKAWLELMLLTALLRFRLPRGAT